MDKTLHIVDRKFDLIQNFGKPPTGKETLSHLFFDFDIGFNLNSILIVALLILIIMF